MEEEEDRILLSTLGVKSANPEDIERDVLEKAARNDSGTVTEAEGSAKEERSDLPENVDPLFSAKAELHQKLRAVQFEIDAVASTIELSSNVENNEECRDAGEDGEGQGNAKGDEASRSVENQKVIFSLVKEERKSKRKVKEDKKYNKSTGKRQKKVSFDDDADFDAVLDAAFAGFVETEHHIRTGCGSVSVIVYEDQEKPALITYPDLALNYMSCFQGLFFCPEAASLLLSRITFSANLQF